MTQFAGATGIAVGMASLWLLGRVDGQDHVRGAVQHLGRMLLPPVAIQKDLPEPLARRREDDQLAHVVTGAMRGLKSEKITRRHGTRQPVPLAGLPRRSCRVHEGSATGWGFPAQAEQRHFGQGASRAGRLLWQGDAIRAVAAGPIRRRF